MTSQATLAAVSREFWSQNQVAHMSPNVTLAESQRVLDWRNNQYPGLLDLMPVDKPGEVILDFGCGPGHDTIMFLQNGAAHVYAADCSWYGLSMLHGRLKAHGFEDKCTLMLVGDGDWRPPYVDHMHAAGVIHHVADPVATLERLSVGVASELRMMVYSAESQFYLETCGGDPETFERIADGAAPIAKAWTRAEVVELAEQAGLDAEYMGSYRSPGETWGPGLNSCWSLR